MTTALALSLAFAGGLILTLTAERVARATSMVARPSADRWSRATVPLLGGVAIVIVTVGLTLVAAAGHRNLVVLALAGLAMAAVGLVDDVRRLSAPMKFLAELLLASVLLYFGLALRLTGYALVDVFLTLFWVVGITNAFNLLDNMDGLAGAIAVVVAAFRLLFFHWEGDARGEVVTAIFIGAVAGFLVRNFPPAKIFMGDSGSLFLGFFLAGLSLTAAGAPYSRGVSAVLAIPVLLLLIPIFDTAFVTMTRVLTGRRVDVGGRDHTSHRLVAIGLSERYTVTFLAALSAAAGGVAVLSYQAGLSLAVVLAGALVIVLVLLGVYLSRIHVVESTADVRGHTVLRLLADFQYKRQVLVLSLDVCLIVLAYYAAYVIRFEQGFWLYRAQLYGSLPIVLLIQLAALASFGLYRGVWEYTGIADVVPIVKAATIGVMASMVALVYTERFAGFSRTVFILDWLLLVLLLLGSRASFRLFAEMLRGAPESFQRVLIYGAGDGGALIAREFLINPALKRIPVGFIDDDRRKHRTRIHGLPVLGGSETLESILREQPVRELIVSSAKIQGNGLGVVTAVCAKLAIPIRRASFRLE